MCRVYLADDVAAIRTLWRIFIEEDPTMEVVGEASDGGEALVGVEELRPDVLVLDLSMPERDGLEVIPVVRTACPETAIVVASSFSGARMAPQALRLGAAAYFEKGGPAGELRRMIREACDAHRSAGERAA